MLAPIRIIIHDFPNFLSEYIKTRIFTFRANALARVAMYVHRDSPGRSYIGKQNAYATNNLRVNAKVHTKISIKGIISPSVLLKGKFKIKNAIKARTSAKSMIKGKGSTRIGRYRGYLEPSKYYIGITLTLEHWDDKRLEDIDGITMGDMSIIEV